MSKKFAITLSEFNRVYQVAHGTIANEATVERSCVFFSIVGSYVLNNCLGVAARPVAGGFLMRPVIESNCIVFAKEEDGRWSWGDDAFHMWVETEDHIIDYMSPIYREAFAKAEFSADIPRKIFQVRKDAESLSPNELEHIGAFFTFPDSALSAELIDLFVSRPINTDLLNVAATWFGHAKKRLRPSMQMMSSDGKLQTLTVPGTFARSAW